MNAKKIYLFMILILLPVHTLTWAQVGFDQKTILRKDAPIEVVSDKMEAYQEKNVVIFSGNAVAKQGDVQLKTDRLAIYYKKQPNPKEKPGAQIMEGTGELDKIEAKGNVIVTQKDMSATGNEAVYYHDTSRVVMTGNALLKQGKNTVKGCKVTVYLDQNRGEVERCTAENSERVTAIIHPEDQKATEAKPGTKTVNKK
jgi:lipopolysaccharide export system protein LptA